MGPELQAGGDVTDLLKAGRDSMLKVRFNSDKWKKAVEKFAKVNAGKAGSHYNATRMLFMLLLTGEIILVNWFILSEFVSFFSYE
jgi:maltodextrin utilization protein YvdJ